MDSSGNRTWIYIVDSSSWIAIEDDPAQNRILSALLPLIENGRIKLPLEVWDELCETFSLMPWMNPHKQDLIDNQRSNVDYLLLGGQVAHRFPGMAGSRGTRNKADPWIVALAKIRDGDPQSTVVVCNETIRNRPNRKIPSACGAYNLRCMSLREMLDQEYPEDGWLD